MNSGSDQRVTEVVFQSEGLGEPYTGWTRGRSGIEGRGSVKGQGTSTVTTDIVTCTTRRMDLMGRGEETGRLFD